ncbi:hypothetical protein EHO60_13455 [Leptospira fletcheri]|uniref:Thioredoxin family protein n=1 Tax=Leptospira fletcheri TaxID=2484981 RepID=A0A4R9GBJ5_9LEPT|nr:hypothetical protein [Leptospira fletcheri]TGK09021.1 hypothetical protein EHO60_13455 [Leptospira fletcheri]
MKDWTKFIFKKRALLVLFGLFCLILWLALNFDFGKFLSKNVPNQAETKEAVFARAEKKGSKGVLFLVEPRNCGSCATIQEQLKSLEAQGWEFLPILPDSSDYERILADDRFSEKLSSLSAGKPVWGAWNLGEELVYLGGTCSKDKSKELGSPYAGLPSCIGEPSAP